VVTAGRGRAAAAAAAASAPVAAGPAKPAAAPSAAVKPTAAPPANAATASKLSRDSVGLSSGSTVKICATDIAEMSQFDFAFWCAKCSVEGYS